ncbi:MAG: FkbM family methyltransferase, partial [Bacteroidota bacterium]
VGKRHTAYTVNGLTYKVPIEAARGLRGMLLGQEIEHERELYQRILALIPPDSVVFDVGAHLGEFSVTAHNSGKARRIVAFEANPITAAQLRGVVAANMLDAVEVEEGAVGEKAGTLTFNVRGNSADSGVTSARKTRTQSASFYETEVQVRALDEFVMSSGIVPDFVKIDVEGFEVPVLRGAEQTLRAHKPIVCVEVHPRDLAALGYNVDTVRDFLTELGYVDTGEAYRRRHDVDDRPYNIVMTPESRG